MLRVTRRQSGAGRARWQGRLPFLCTSPVSFGPPAKAATTIQALLAALPLAILVFAVAVFVIRYKIRETIKVGDILNGRHFACRSIITLLEKKQQISEMAEKFTQFLEALKNWGGREVIEMAPDRPPIARFVERPQAAE